MMRKICFVLASLALAVYAEEAAEPKAVKPEATEPKEAPAPMLKVLCQPASMARGAPIYLNMEYASFFTRPMEIHVDLLDAATNQWIAGDAVKVTGAAGKVTTRLFVPADAPQALKYNAYITPQGEQWPNMIAQTSFEAPLGDKVVDPCAPLRNSARTPKSNPDFNYVLIQDYPSGIKTGAETQVKVQYNVQPGSEPMYVSVAMLKNADNSVVATATEKAEEGEHLTTLKLAVPADAAIEPVHFMSTLKPIGKAFSERVAEDRVWSLGLYNRRNLRA